MLFFLKEIFWEEEIWLECFLTGRTSLTQKMTGYEKVKDCIIIEVYLAFFAIEDWQQFKT